MADVNTAIKQLKQKILDIDDDWFLRIVKQEGSSLHILQAVEPEKAEHQLCGKIDLYGQWL